MPSKIDIRDLGKEENPAPLVADLCIIGSGPAGAALAMSFANSPWSVLILESGALKVETMFAAGLNAVEDISATPYGGSRPDRNRIVGGTSHTWSGRCRSLDECDLQTRPWIPHSGWPVSLNGMSAHLDRASAILGLQPWNDTEIANRQGIGEDELRKLAANGLRPIYWQFSRPPGISGDYARFGKSLRNLRASNIRIYTNATVAELIPNGDGTRIESLRVLTPQHRAYTVRCRFVALCAGGIENARLMLASQSRAPQGIGNRYDLVGRFLMDHPRTTVGVFPPLADAEIQRSYGIFFSGRRAVLQRGICWNSAAMSERHLPNAAAWTTQHVADDDVWREARNMILPLEQNRWQRAKRVLHHSSQIAEGLWRAALLQPLPRRFSRVDLDVTIEQRPDPESRITLSSRRDAFGTPLPRIDWRISESERWAAIKLARAFDAALAQSAMPRPILEDWVLLERPQDARFSNMAHPIGTTRMARSPEQGVVDGNSQVFGIHNLFVAGSSVFPTASHANPTLMIVALALRLAGHLELVLKAGLVPNLALSNPPKITVADTAASAALSNC
jgi:choline dehydrogenase-like flavoprotein